MSAPSPRRRVRIERLELDVRGVAPATANAAAHALGPALARTLASRSVRVAAADRIDAGRIVGSASPDAHDLVTRIARRIASTIHREGV